MNNTKVCTVCQVEKEESSFAFKNKKLCKLHSRCKDCQAKYHRKHYLANKEYYSTKRRVNSRRYRTAGRKFIDEYKSNASCHFCSENTPCCLDFHHLDPTKKNFNVSQMKGHAKTVDAIKKEVEKCIVVCSNCHRKIHAGILIAHEGIEPPTSA